MKIPPLHYAVILLMDDFNQNPSQIATRLDLSLRYVYDIINRYRKGQTLTPDHQYECNSTTTQTRLKKYR
jgi:transposase